jgi:hypothetical protein
MMVEVLWGDVLGEGIAVELGVGNAREGYGDLVACYAIVDTYSVVVLLGW